MCSRGDRGYCVLVQSHDPSSGFAWLQTRCLICDLSKIRFLVLLRCEADAYRIIPRGVAKNPKSSACCGRHHDTETDLFSRTRRIVLQLALPFRVVIATCTYQVGYTYMIHHTGTRRKYEVAYHNHHMLLRTCYVLADTTLNTVRTQPIMSL